MLENLIKDEVWRKFLADKEERSNFTKQELSELKAFVDEKGYLSAVKSIPFSPPAKKQISKIETSKKRTVYCFPREQAYVLKLLANLLHAYDGIFAPNLFSFRKDFGVRRAITSLLLQIKNRNLYCYKLDISNYFNSVPVDLLLPKIKAVFSEKDQDMYGFFEALLVWKNETAPEEHGVMAGTPTSAFLSNLFLSDLDRHFFDQKIPYARYSDDIIVFAETEAELTSHVNFISDYLTKNRLKINEKKVQLVPPRTPFTYLGIEYDPAQNTIDLSPITVEKMKDKIRRKSHALLRWKTKKNVPDDKALGVMIKVFNKKFFDPTGTNDLTWCNWYFPLLTTDKGLKEVDAYLQDNLRFLVTAKHNKKNYEKVPYSRLKDAGYISLVNRFYSPQATQGS